MANAPVRIIGIDPGLRRTGWGVIAADGSRLRWIAHGVVAPPDTAPFSERLLHLFEALGVICADHDCDEAAVEEVFVNVNPSSTLKLGHARAAAVLAPAKLGLTVAEYSPNLIKKAVVGAGHADKGQIAFMIKRLLPAAGDVKADAADALAVAITHAQLRKHRILTRMAGEGDRPRVSPEASPRTGCAEEGANPRSVSEVAPSATTQGRRGPPPPHRFASRGRIT